MIEIPHYLLGAIQIIALIFIIFVPVWAGGQAMRCYNDGQVFKSAGAVFLAVCLNAAGMLAVAYVVRYEWELVTIFSNLSL